MESGHRRYPLLNITLGWFGVVLDLAPMVLELEMTFLKMSHNVLRLILDVPIILTNVMKIIGHY